MPTEAIFLYTNRVTQLMRFAHDEHELVPTLASAHARTHAYTCARTVLYAWGSLCRADAIEHDQTRRLQLYLIAHCERIITAVPLPLHVAPCF